MCAWCVPVIVSVWFIELRQLTKDLLNARIRYFSRILCVAFETINYWLVPFIFSLACVGCM